MTFYKGFTITGHAVESKWGTSHAVQAKHKAKRKLNWLGRGGIQDRGRPGV